MSPTSPRRRELLRDLRTAAVAVVAASLVLAAPSIAATVKNADKVDGKHAVGFTAPISVRAGKLVATNGQGRLPNNIIVKAPDANLLDGRDSSAFVPVNAPRGSLQTGGYDAWGGGAGTFLGATVRLPSRLPVLLPSSRVTFIPSFAPATPECPGVGQVVPNGWLCLYEQGSGGSTFGGAYRSDDGGTQGVARTGFGLYFSCAASECWNYGAYALRAGSSADVPIRPHGRAAAVAPVS